MKRMKRLLWGYVLALFAAGFVCAPSCVQAHVPDTFPVGGTVRYFQDYGHYTLASADNWTAPNKGRMRISVKNYAQDFIRVTLDKEGYDIQNIRTSGKALTAWRAGKRTDNHYEKDEQQEQPALKKTYIKHDVYIGLFAKKKGAYKVSFDIVDGTGKRVAGRTVKVYATNESPFRDICLNKKKIMLNASGWRYIDGFRLGSPKVKINVKMTKGYRLKKILCSKSGSTGKSKKVRNGSTVDMRKYYWIEIFYADKYTGETKSVTIGVNS